MKIGTVAFHFGINYGAVLQCYALKEHLRSIGHDVTVVNYVTERQARVNSLHHRKKNLLVNCARNAALLPFEGPRRRRQEAFAAFVSDFPLGPRVKTVEELAAYVDSEGFDVLIAGSDQVFNPKGLYFDRGNLLPFETRARKVAFAASIGRATADDLAPYRDALSAFDDLSVREASTVSVFEEACGCRPHAVCDSVFLLDRSRWEELASKSRTGSEKVVLCYYLDKRRSSEYLELSHVVAQALGASVKAVSLSINWDSFRREAVLDAGPVDFLSSIRSASFVCTDSFHGTAFSLIFGKPFVSFEPTKDSRDPRKKDILAKVGQSWRSVAADSPDVEACVARVAQAPAPNVQAALASIRDEQDAFLLRALGGGETSQQAHTENGTL